MSMQVMPGIHRIEAPLEDRYLCCYLLIGDLYVMLVDSGLDSTPREYILPYLTQIAGRNRKIDYVVTTHGDFDHMGGNASIREVFPNAHFVSHHLDRRWIEDVEALINENYGQFDLNHGTKPDSQLNAWIHKNTRATSMDQEIRGGESFQLGRDWWVDIIHTPGHTRGHLSVIDPRTKTAIVADAALADGLVSRSCEPLYPPTYRYLEDYRRSAEVLATFSPSYLLTSHYPIMTTAAALDFLQKTKSFTDRCETGILGMLKAATRPVSGLHMARALSPILGRWPAEASSLTLYPLVAHLEVLEHCGVVTISRSSGIQEYQATNA